MLGGRVRVQAQVRTTQRVGPGPQEAFPGGTHPAPELGVQLADEVKEPLAGDQEAVAGNSDKSSVNLGTLPRLLGKNIQVKSDDGAGEAEAVKPCGKENRAEVRSPPLRAWGHKLPACLAGVSPETGNGAFPEVSSL